MISKILTGKSFSGLCRYLCQDRTRALVLEASGVREYDHNLMAADFEQQRQLNPGINKPVFHAILSFYPGEEVAAETMKQIAREYLLELGIKNTQAVVVRHNDRKHQHLHIVVNRVDNDGKAIKDNWVGLRGKKVAQELTLKYELVPANRKSLALTNLPALNEYQAHRYEIFQAISDHLPKCKTLTDLEQKLLTRSIAVLYKYKGRTNELQGISFQIGKYKYKGSEIDRQFSIKNLEKTLARNLVLSQKSRKHQPLSQDQHKLLEKMLQKEHSMGSNLLEELMRPEYLHDQLPYEFLKKKRKQKSQGL